MSRPKYQKAKKLVNETLIEDAIQKVLYVGSPEHKVPTARADASLCPKCFRNSEARLTQELREAIRKRQFDSQWENVFPRKVWCQIDGQFFEGRLTNRDSGWYKGYPISEAELPKHFRGNL